MNELMGKVANTLRDEGIIALKEKTVSYIKTKRIKKRAGADQVFRDILFINGCGENVPHPARYRITHQREQLAYYNISSNEVFYQYLSLDMVRLYRAFIFFRCPYNETIEQFIQCAKKLNKEVFYDIDDLVIDTKYTDAVPYLNTMKREEREKYDENVMAMGKLLKMCDAAITTTTILQQELLNYVSEVLINRNTASEEMERLSEEAIHNKKKSQLVEIGYFSGSITHNDDFNMILPVLSKLLNLYDNLRLHIVGNLCIPEELEVHRGKIVIHPFVDWRELPGLISQVDINLAPLTDILFNEAKSENKWMEAALVQVPTVASNLGAFKENIVQEETGILCNTIDEWENALIDLIDHPDKRRRIGKKAYDYCKKFYLAYKRGYEFVDFLNHHIKKNILFVLPSLEISGGVLVALKHADILQKAGYDVSLGYLNAEQRWYKDSVRNLPVILTNDGMMEGMWDIAVATMWSTLQNIVEYPRITRRCYLVQGYETAFYGPGNPLRKKANITYSATNGVIYLTISKWCQKWLEKEFGQKAKYAPNGISFKQFNERSRERGFSGKIKILIEGDCLSDHKNVDESFRIVEMLDKENFEIWYMSYKAKPKQWYHVDRLFHKIPHEKVGKVYRQCDILLKSSIIESFSYPPLEMMATGGIVVAVPNGGNLEYLVDEENCLMYEKGNIKKAVSQIERICKDTVLRHELYLGGIKTAKKRDWGNLEEKIKALYMEE